MSASAGSSGTPLPRKLGIREGVRVLLVGAPPSHLQRLEPLPEAVTFVERSSRDVDIVHVFTTRRTDLARTLASYRAALHPDAIVWVSWPKKSAKVATDITEDVIREVALPLGWVDVKVCAI
ncbi:MAG TPA: DUF3052 domain-containing protein, partial [Casimicrobiaceae bacterium]|nr:DUF3052 domain-containing protein [Casimicrobiaceae bacterium]